MKRLRSKSGWAAIAVVILALFLVRPGAQQLKTRIVNSISAAVGRRVEVGSVSIRFLPQPGFELDDFVVYDDPAFSAEPMLRAPEVVAGLRLSSLLHGRLEVSRLSLSDPSLNLVRNDKGHWSLENLLERAAKTPVAPTAKPSGEPRPGFPYIEADNGRINLKLRQEKKAVALDDADFSLWQDSENSWGLRLKARPIRTDFNLTDTGTIQASGTWLRAATLRQTPLQFTVQWRDAQLGQASQLVYGADRGWRGEVGVSVALRGTPEDLHLQTAVSIQDFRRYDLLGSQVPRLAGQCQADYTSTEHSLSQIVCEATAGTGSMTLKGSVARMFGPPVYSLNAIAERVPVQSVAALLRSIKKDLPDDITATGSVDAILKLHRDAGKDSVAEGDGEISGLRIQSALNRSELTLNRVPFVFSSETTSRSHKIDKFTSMRQLVRESRVEFGPLNLALGQPKAAVVAGWISASGYDIALRGDVDVQRLLRLGRMLGVPSPQLSADGSAQVSLQLGGSWAGFSPPRAVGTVQLHDVRADVQGINAPLEISSASVLLNSKETRVESFSASIAGATWHGSLTLPRPCATASSCAVGFVLHTDEIAAGKLADIFRKRQTTRPWYQLFSGERAGASYLSVVHASGSIAVGRLVTNGIPCTRLSAGVALNAGKFQLRNVRADAFDGRYRGEWKADLSATPPEISGDGSLDRIALPQLASAMQDDWITGTASGDYHIKTHGTTWPELLAAATGEVTIKATDGILPHLVLVEPESVQMRLFTGDLLLREGSFRIEDGKLETPENVYAVSGTVTLARRIDLKLLHEGGRDFAITGSLNEPVVKAISTSTRAALKQ